MILDSEKQRTNFLRALGSVTVVGEESALILVELAAAVRSAKVEEPKKAEEPNDPGQ